LSAATNCPACGGPVRFTIASAVTTVCEYCRSVVARTDIALEDLGKVGQLVDTGSPLSLGLTGKVREGSFRVVGHIQIRHHAGGVWNEWFLHFGNDWGWLAEAQGRFFLSFPEPDQSKLDYGPEALELGKPAPGAKGLTVAELGTGTFIAGEGELPERIEPGIEYPFADLSGPGGAFGTLDFAERPARLFLGRALKLEELGLSIDPEALRVKEKRITGAEQINCPNCGGPLEIKLPDESMRVTCPSCSSLLGIDEGKLKYLRPTEPLPFTPAIPIGGKGKLEGKTWDVLGVIRRVVTAQGVEYPWNEYLLHEGTIGFRWLVQANDHWAFVEPVEPGVVEKMSDRKVRVEGKTFSIFNRDKVTVSHVLGEFYWKVQAGDQTFNEDYIAPPVMYSMERSLGTTPEGRPTAEVNWSRGVYKTVEEVETAFGVTGLTRPMTVGMIKPFTGQWVYGQWLTAIAVIMALLVVSLINNPRREVLNEVFQFKAGTEPAEQFSTKSFKLDGWHNVRVEAKAPVDNAWLEIAGSLYNQETGVYQPFSAPISYYQGVEDGERWSEGSQRSVSYLSAPPAGEYTLRLEADWSNRTTPASVAITIHQGWINPANWIIAMVAVSIIPLLTFIGQCLMEGARWGQSDFANGGVGGSSGGDE
jgi:hypothetical protein